MDNKRARLARARLYIVLDAAVADWDRLLSVADQAVGAGADIVQIRAKDVSGEDVLTFSEKILPLVRDRALYIVNDDPCLARVCRADGVHVGQDDAGIAQAREIMGDSALVGVSCQTMDQAQAAEAGGADYIGFGSVFKTLTKPGRRPMDLSLLNDVLAAVRIPVFPIGGITEENAACLLQAGARRAAVTRAVCLAEDVPAAVKQLITILDNTQATT
ncbi:MAG: thiamine phosphate synthase [Candidatus Omnitrophota bacterium]